MTRRRAGLLLALVLALAAAPAPAARQAAPGLVSKQDPSLGGAPADGNVDHVSVSSDGRRAVFVSGAENLTAQDDATPELDVFVHDRSTGATALLSPRGRIGYHASIADGGRWVTFVTASEAHEPGDVHLVDLRTGARRIVGRNSTTYGYAYPQAPPRLSGDGRVVAYVTAARRGHRVVAYDRRTGRRRTLSRSRSRERISGASISPDGRFVAWSGLASARGSSDDVVSVYRYDRLRRTRRRIDRYRTGCCIISHGAYGTSLSRDGRRLAYVSRVRGAPVVAVHDRRSGRRRIASRGRRGAFVAGDPSISADGRRVAFTVPSPSYSHVTVKDLRRGTVRQLREGSGQPDLSASGRWLAYVGYERDPSQAFVVRTP